jgi:hypothetical protein
VISNESRFTQTTYYRRKVTEINSGTIGYSDFATIFVFPQLQGGTISGSQTINYNTQPAAFINTQTANGGNCSGSYIYLWQQSTDNITFNDMGLFTGATLAPGGLTATTYFRRKVTCGSETAYSNTLTVTTNAAVSAGIIAQTTINIASGTSPRVLVADPASGGACGNSFVYQWQSASPGSSFADISGATALDYTSGTLTAATNFRRKVTCGTDVEYSNTCQIVVGTPLSAMNYIRVRDFTATGILTDAAHELAGNRLVDVENMTETELKVIHKAEKEESLQKSHSIEEAEHMHELKKEMEANIENELDK